MIKNKGMTRTEVLVIGIILAIIGIGTILNLSRSKMLARDVQRKNDVRAIASALGEYTELIGLYPQAVDGKIKACGAVGSFACEWGQDSVEASQTALINPLPRDPFWTKNYSYFYRSAFGKFQLFAHLENKNDDEYSTKIEELGLKCGIAVCNFGVSSSWTIPPAQDITQPEP